MQCAVCTSNGKANLLIQLRLRCLLASAAHSLTDCLLLSPESITVSSGLKSTTAFRIRLSLVVSLPVLTSFSTRPRLDSPPLASIPSSLYIAIASTRLAHRKGGTGRASAFFRVSDKSVRQGNLTCRSNNVYQAARSPLSGICASCNRISPEALFIFFYHCAEAQAGKPSTGSTRA